MEEYVIGLDVSLRHLGLCILNPEGFPYKYAFATDVKKYPGLDPHGTYYKDPENVSVQICQALRIGFFRNFVERSLASLTLQDYPAMVALEDYAAGSLSPRQLEVAEQTGNIKQSLFDNGYPFRTIEPKTLKVFAVGNGNALKIDMVNQFSVEQPASDLAQYKDRILKSTKKEVKQKGQKVKVEEMDGPGTDVIDAYFLARALWTELKLRRGEITLQDLPEHQIRYFNTTTIAHPLNVLGRPFIAKVQPELMK